MLVAPVLAFGQPKKARLGLLATGDETSVPAFFLDAFLAGMRELGYERDRNFVIDIRYARGDMSRLPALADELIALKPELLMGIEPVAHVLVTKTRTIPIVLVGSSDPVASGLVKSFARPGTNVTGMAHLYTTLVAKQIEILAELVPNLSRVAWLGDSSAPEVNRELVKQVLTSAAAAKGLRLIETEAQDAAGIRQAFARMKAELVQAVVVSSTGTMVYFRQEVTGEAQRLRIPAIYSQSDVVLQGGLVSYGADLPASYRRDVPRFVDQILRGGRPAELPVQQTTKYEMVINLKTARAIGLNVPRAMLLRADRVIE